ncbi:hypothetical protein [Leptolyngbya sp. NIES-2104]|uniref:hypothetical protein n=1 Tax=Leptolyngbya sp. NIES-2104 TaxID=1552121 RepID=UPI0006EC53CD|nr:hypothetical protein [Leptolyngbya sp. NIES-2104]GAP96574.1 hypothetical protein NIES2104_31120 [Leptolyngbya sp. NIES-2104]
MILFLRHPKSDSWNFSWDRRREQTSAEIRDRRKQAEAISKVQSESFLKFRTLL